MFNWPFPAGCCEIDDDGNIDWSDEEGNIDDWLCVFDNDSVVGSEGDCIDEESCIDDDDDDGEADGDRCVGCPFSANLLDGTEKNKLEFVLPLSNEEGERPNTVKRSVLIITIKQQVKTTASANHSIFFLWLTMFERTPCFDIASIQCIFTHWYYSIKYLML